MFLLVKPFHRIVKGWRRYLKSYWKGSDWWWKQQGGRFLQCKETINVATIWTSDHWEIHTKRLNHVHLHKKYKIAVIGIQEHRIVHNDNSQLQYENMPEGFQLVTASASRNSCRWSMIPGYDYYLAHLPRRLVVIFIKNTASYSVETLRQA